MRYKVKHWVYDIGTRSKSNQSNLRTAYQLRVRGNSDSKKKKKLKFF